MAITTQTMLSIMNISCTMLLPIFVTSALGCGLSLVIGTWTLTASRCLTSLLRRDFVRSKILLWGHGVIRCKTPARARPEKISCSCPQKCRPFCGRSRFHMMFGLITRSYWVHFITPTSFLLSGAGQHQRHFHGQSILQTWCNGNVMMACPRMHMPRYGPRLRRVLVTTCRFQCPIVCAAVLKPPNRL